MDFQDAYERALADPEFLSRFARRYTGPHDPLDALFWASHPERVGPSTAAGPASQRRLLEQDVYSEGADGPARAAAIEALEALDSETSAERARVTLALTEPDVSALGPSGSDPGDGSFADEVRGPPAMLGDLELLRPARTVLDRRLLLGAAAVLLVGIAVGWLGSTLADPLRGSGGPAAAGSTLSPSIEELFAAPQRAVDIPQSVIFAQIGGISDIDVDTARFLDLGLRGENVMNQAFVAKSNEGDICAFLTHDDGRIARSCAAPERFAASGLSISWTTTENFRAGRPPEPSAIGITINPDGTITPSVTRYFYLGGSVTDEDGVPTPTPTATGVTP